MSTILVQVTLVGETAEVTVREGDGRGTRRCTRYRSCAFSTWFWSLFHNIIIFLYILLVMHKINTLLNDKWVKEKTQNIKHSPGTKRKVKTQ